MSLQLYLQNAWIRRHETSPDEIANLLAIADRDIAQSQTPGLGPEWRFDIAYNAALQLAVAALAACGYQAERQNKHQRSIECLAFTVGLDAKLVDFLDRCRRKRHAAGYDQVGAISDQEAGEMISSAQRLRKLVGAWLRSKHPELVGARPDTTDGQS
jgi:hypothetical protein